MWLVATLTFALCTDSLFCSLAAVCDVALTGQHAWKQGNAPQLLGREKRTRENRGGGNKKGGCSFFLS